MFAKHHLCGGADTHHFAAQRHHVQICLEDLRFAPARFELLGKLDLPKFLQHVAPCVGALQVGVQQARELHGDGGRAARLGVPRVGPSTGGQGLPIHAAVLPELLVFALHHGIAQGRRHLRQPQPGGAAHGEVNAQRLDGLTAAVAQQDVGWLVLGAHLGKVGQLKGGICTGRRGHNAGKPGPAKPTSNAHQRTSKVKLGVSPKVSGAYMASTLVGGKANRPEALSRIVYSATCLPRGSHS